jgi:processive 1,2-diacylglycerol beta-glucosyltransferase
LPPDLVVIHSPVGGGHKAAAIAVAEAALIRGLSVELLDTFEHAPRVFGQAYLTAHLVGQGALPDLYGTAYFAANRRNGAFEPIRRGVDHVAWAGLVRRVRELAPRAVIATHHLPLVVLGRARRTRRLAAPLVGVVTDYGTHAVWAEKGVDSLCVPCDRAFRDAVAHGVAIERIRMTGIPVRAAFERVPDLEEPTSGAPLRVLVTSGGFGVGPIGAIVHSFEGIDDVALTVVCGRANGLADRVRSIAARTGVRAEVLGFERDMPARVAAAHVVVGKAGGLTVSETMTGGRPMVIAGAVPGNETINADLVVKGGAGLVAKPCDVGATVAWLRASGALANMGRRARALVPTSAADSVIDAALQSADGWSLPSPRPLHVAQRLPGP